MIAVCSGACRRHVYYPVALAAAVCTLLSQATQPSTSCGIACCSLAFRVSSAYLAPDRSMELRPHPFSRRDPCLILPERQPFHNSKRCFPQFVGRPLVLD